MSVDPSVLSALEAALAADPENAALRLHLAALLADAGEPARALAHARAVLETRPVDADALRVAARATRATGDDAVADGYEQILRALGADPAAPNPIPQAVPTLPSHDPEFNAELEALLLNEADRVDVEEPDLTLADVAGLDDAKAEIQRKFLAPMRNPELRALYRKSLRGGLLLYGPPGCGKTFIARAIAGEIGAKFSAVGIHDILEMWVGSSERNIHEAFERARRNAPCVLFFDEVDALGQKRSHLAHSGVRSTVAEFLTELDGIDGEQNEGVFVLGATNQPWDVDPALRRPGRFDRTVLVIPPDAVARAEILRLHLRDRPIEHLNLERLARRTERFSGADLRLVCETAAEFAIDDSIRVGHARAITQADLERAIGTTAPSTLPWFEAARNFVTFGNNSGEWDRLYQFMKATKLL